MISCLNHINIQFYSVIKLSLWVVLYFNCQAALAQNTFYKTVGHSIAGSEGRNVAAAADGGYFLSYYMYVSSEYVSCVTKFNCTGTKEWEKFYSDGLVTIPTQILPQFNNGCLVSFSNRNNSGIWQNVVMKLDEQGNTRWTARLQMQVGGATGSMVQHTDGSIYLCGNDTVAANIYRGTTLAKLDSFGNLIWQKHYADGQDHSPMGLTITSDNKIAVYGRAGFDALPFSNLFVFTTTTNGVFLDRKIFSTYYDDEPNSICADGSGNIYLTGRSYFLNSQWDIMFLKLNSQLNILESKFIDGSTINGEVGRYILSTSDNSIAIFGDEGTFDERNPLVLHFDEFANLNWSKHYLISPLFTNYIFQGAETQDGGFLMTGDARPANQFRIAPFIKINSVGEMGCFTSNFPVTIREEIMSVLDTSLNTYPVLYPMDTTALPFSTLMIPTSNTSFCQNLIPCGNFTFNQDSVCPKACFSFTDHSFNTGTWAWTFEDGIPATSNEQNPTNVCFLSDQLHKVSLTLTNPLGSVTYTQYVKTVINCPVFIPNIFTPNGDGLNDVFYAKGFNGEFVLKIFNRWGTLVFESGNPGKWWNGNSMHGNKLSDGIYFYLLKNSDTGIIYHGNVQLIR